MILPRDQVTSGALMENHTFRSRLVLLVQKSRKAVRLYSSMEKNSADSGADFRETQAEEWKSVTSELLRELTVLLENPNARRLAGDIYTLRDRFYSDWRLSESDLHVGQRDLINASEHGDFTRASVLSIKLIRLKARVQASQAAYHELNEVVTKSKISDPNTEILPVADSTEIEIPLFDTQPSVIAGHLGSTAKVIPLRKKQLLSA